MSSSITEPTNVGGVVLLPPVEADENDRALDVYDPSTVGKGLDFFDRFADKPNAQAILVQIAQQEFPKILANPNSIVDFGNDALDDVVAASKEVMRVNRDVQLPDDDESAIQNVQIQLSKAGQYDMSVAENVEKYRKMKAKLTKGFGKKKAKAWFAAFNADRMSLEQLTEEMSGDLIKKSKERAVSANMSQALFKANRESVNNLSERIAILEQVRHMAQQERNKLPASVPATDPLADKIATMDLALRMLDVKITGFAERWYVAYAMDPVLRETHKEQIMMAMTFRMAGTTGMEKINFILTMYANSLKMQNDIDSVAQLSKLDNDLTQKMIKQARISVVESARVTSGSTMDDNTITVVAQEVSGMLSDLQNVYAQAKLNHESKIKSIEAGVAVIGAAQDAPVDKTKVGQIIGEAKKSRSLLSN